MARQPAKSGPPPEETQESLMELRLALPGPLVNVPKPLMLFSRFGRIRRISTPMSRGDGLEALEWLADEAERRNVHTYVDTIYVLDPETPHAVAVLEIADAGILQIIERVWLERYGEETRAASQP